MKYRTEFDSIGKIKVDGDKYWGASTERSKKYFNIGDFLVRPIVIHSIAIIKKAAAIVNTKNKDLGFVDEHILPTNCLIDFMVTLISQGESNDSVLDTVLDKYFIVKLNTDHDELIRNAGISRKMPKDWNILTDDPFMR